MYIYINRRHTHVHIHNSENLHITQNLLSMVSSLSEARHKMTSCKYVNVSLSHLPACLLILLTPTLSTHTRRALFCLCSARTAVKSWAHREIYCRMLFYLHILMYNVPWQVHIINELVIVQQTYGSTTTRTMQIHLAVECGYKRVLRVWNERYHREQSKYHTRPDVNLLMPYPHISLSSSSSLLPPIPSHIHARKIDTETLTLSLILLSFATIFSTDYKTHSERLLDYVSQMLHFKWFFLESSFVFRGVACYARARCDDREWDSNTTLVLCKMRWMVILWEHRYVHICT